MKKTIIILAALMIIKTGVASAQYDFINSNISELSYDLNFDFETDDDYVELPASVVGVVTTSVETEDGNRFLRVNGASDADNLFVLTPPAPLQGSYVITFDARIDSPAYRHVPNVIGTNENGGVAPLATFVLLDSGKITNSKNGFQVDYTPKAWHNHTIVIDTEKDTVSFAVDGKLIVQNEPTLVKVQKVDRFRMLLRGKVSIDLDNIRVYEGELKASAADTPSQTDGNTKATLEDMPIRYPEAIVSSTLSVYRPKGEIVVDGSLSEQDWQYEYTALGKMLLGDSPAKARFAVMWDENGLYVAGKAVDKASYFSVPQTPWEGDAFEIFIDGGNEKNSTYDENDRQLLIALNGDTVYGANRGRFYSEGVRFAYQKTKDGYSIEVFIPYTNFWKESLKAGMEVGFDIGYDDNLNGSGREAQFVWAGTSVNSKNPSGLGKIVLSNGFAADNLSEYYKALNGKIALLINSPKAIVNAEAVVIDEDNKDVSPFIFEDRTYLPLRFISESMAFDVNFDSETNTVTMTKDDINVTIIIGGLTMTVNGGEQAMDTPALIVNDRTFLPVRALSDALGKAVAWHEDGIVIIGAEQLPDMDVLSKIKFTLGGMGNKD